MGRFNAMTSNMRPLFEGIRLVGTAVTVKTLAADLSAAFKAIDVSQPGDIVVIDSHGSIDTAFWGENMTMSAPWLAGARPPGARARSGSVPLRSPPSSGDAPGRNRIARRCRRPGRSLVRRSLSGLMQSPSHSFVSFCLSKTLKIHKAIYSSRRRFGLPKTLSQEDVVPYEAQLGL